MHQEQAEFADVVEDRGQVLDGNEVAVDEGKDAEFVSKALEPQPVAEQA